MLSPLLDRHPHTTQLRPHATWLGRQEFVEVAYTAVRFADPELVPGSFSGSVRRLDYEPDMPEVQADPHTGGVRLTRNLEGLVRRAYENPGALIADRGRRFYLARGLADLATAFVRLSERDFDACDSVEAMNRPAVASLELVICRTIVCSWGGEFLSGLGLDPSLARALSTEPAFRSPGLVAAFLHALGGSSVADRDAFVRALARTAPYDKIGRLADRVIEATRRTPTPALRTVVADAITQLPVKTLSMAPAQRGAEMARAGLDAVAAHAVLDAVPYPGHAVA